MRITIKEFDDKAIYQKIGGGVNTQWMAEITIDERKFSFESSSRDNARTMAIAYLSRYNYIQLKKQSA